MIANDKVIYEVKAYIIFNLHHTANNQYNIHNNKYNSYVVYINENDSHVYIISQAIFSLHHRQFFR